MFVGACTILLGMLLKCYLLQCRVGSELKVKVGGQFCFKEYDDGVGILLVAGGIGINPMFSMLQEYTSSLTSPHIHMLYTASSMEELLFKVWISILSCWSLMFFFTQNDLDALISDNVKITYFITRQPVQPSSNVHSKCASDKPYIIPHSFTR